MKNGARRAAMTPSTVGVNTKAVIAERVCRWLGCGWDVGRWLTVDGDGRWTVRGAWAVLASLTHINLKGIIPKYLIENLCVMKSTCNYIINFTTRSTHHPDHLRSLISRRTSYIISPAVTSSLESHELLCQTISVSRHTIQQMDRARKVSPRELQVH